MENGFWRKCIPAIAVMVMYLVALFGLAALVALGTPADAGELEDRYHKGVAEGTIIQFDEPRYLGSAAMNAVARMFEEGAVDGRILYEYIGDGMILARSERGSTDLCAAWGMYMPFKEDVLIYAVAYEPCSEEY